MAAAVIADLLRGHAREALVFGGLEAGIITLAFFYARRGNGWVRNLSQADYRRGAAVLAAVAVACLVLSVTFLGHGAFTPILFMWFGVAMIFVAWGAWLPAVMISRALDAVEPEHAVAICLGSLAPHRRAAVLVLTEDRIIAFPEFRLRGAATSTPRRASSSRASLVQRRSSRAAQCPC